MEKLRTNFKNLNKKPGVFADFAPETANIIVCFDEKRFQRDPKLCALRQVDMGIHLGTIGLSREEREEGTEGAMRNQVTGHGDPLRNHRAEAEEARH